MFYIFPLKCRVANHHVMRMTFVDSLLRIIFSRYDLLHNQSHILRHKKTIIKYTTLAHTVKKRDRQTDIQTYMQTIIQADRQAYAASVTSRTCVAQSVVSFGLSVTAKRQGNKSYFEAEKMI